ncbi:hypothetical protein BDZ97DRAFT_366384 [Flammula alnicola]|nr:hypothetical protein BDZ97DRAFT_366384 [Flammula alnicola]
MHSSSISRLAIFLALVVAVSATPSIVSRAAPSVVARRGSPKKPAHGAHKNLKQFNIRTTPTRGMRREAPSNIPKLDGIFERAINATVNVAPRFVYEDSARRQEQDEEDEGVENSQAEELLAEEVPEGVIPTLTQ